jgi:hypothetical protein
MLLLSRFHQKWKVPPILSLKKHYKISQKSAQWDPSCSTRNDMKLTTVFCKLLCKHT